MEAQTQNINCIICADVITNPICARCLAKEMEQWLSAQGIGTILIWEAPKSEFEEDASGVPCIICKNRVGVCSHCYVKEIYEWVCQQNEPLAHELIRNFDLGFEFIKFY